MSRIADQARVSSRLVSILILLGLLVGLMPVLPVQADPPVDYSYDFTGEDDDPWEAGWTHFSSDPSEDMPTIEFDAGRHDGSGHGVISLRPETMSDSVQQVRAVFYDPDEDEQTWGLVMRSDGSGYLSDSGYYCALEYYDNDEDALLGLFRADDGDWQALDDPIEVSLSGDVWLKCEAQGPDLRVKLWEVGTAEPSGWDFEVTDSTYTSGRSGILQYADRHVDVFVDDYSLEEYSAGPPAAEELSIASPLDGATVFSVTTIAASVLPSQAEGTVEVSVDGNLIGSAPIDAGGAALDWDTTTVGDGPVTVEVAALDSQGALAASASITVSVENDLDASERLATDYEAGQIDTSDYVELGLMSLYAFDLLPERYSVPPDDPDAEGNGLVIEYLSLWDQLDQTTQERLGQAVEATLTLDFETAAGLWEFGGGQQAASQPSGQAQILSTWPECFTYFNGVTACTHSSEHFEIFYVPESLAGAYVDSGVEDSDTISRNGTEIVACLPICNQVPDYVDRVAAALEQGWATYGGGGLGFRMPSTPVRVSIIDTRAHTFPNLFAQATIVVNNVNDHFSTPRHELFHMVQYEYAGLLDLVGPGVLAWLEATAEWGAHQAARPDDNQGVTDPDSPYYNRIGAVLSRPNWSALTYEDDRYSLGNPFRRQRRQYGMFLLAEHLEESLAAPGSDTTIVERTWELIDAGNDATEAIAQVAADHGPTGWSEADQLIDFHVDAYVLTDQGALGFDDGDALAWRNRLSPPLAGILDLPDQRPLAVEHDFDEAGTWDPTTQERRFVSSGGSVYALVDLEDVTGSPLTGTLFVDAPAIENLAYTLVLFDGYPSLCADQPDPIRIDSGPGTAGSDTITLTGTCDEALLVISHTSLDLVGSLDLEPGTSGVGVQTDWTITVADVLPSPLNWDFETGDLTGWTLVEEAPSGNWYQVVSPGLLGTNHAFRIETGADPILGIEQTVMVDWRDCVVTAYATGQAGTTARLEVRDASNGTVWASHDHTFTGAEVEPVRLLADATSFLPDIYTVRLLYVGRTSPTAVVTFDQVEAATCE